MTCNSNRENSPIQNLLHTFAVVYQSHNNNPVLQMLLHKCQSIWQVIYEAEKQYPPCYQNQTWEPFLWGCLSASQNCSCRWNVNLWPSCSWVTDRVYFPRRSLVFRLKALESRDLDISVRLHSLHTRLIFSDQSFCVACFLFPPCCRVYCLDIINAAALALIGRAKKGQFTLEQNFPVKNKLNWCYTRLHLEFYTECRNV